MRIVFSSKPFNCHGVLFHLTPSVVGGKRLEHQAGRLPWLALTMLTIDYESQLVSADEILRVIRKEMLSSKN